jgi:hypothetical protein
MTKTEKSVKTGMKVIRKAIKQNLSLSEAARQSDLGRNYVSDVKLRLPNNYKNRKINKETYNEFKALIKKYND